MYNGENFVYPQEYYTEIIEKKQIKNVANQLSVCYIVMVAVMIFWSYAYIYFGLKLGFTRNELAGLVKNENLRDVFQILLSSLAFLLPYSVFVKIRGERISDLISFEKPKKGITLPVILLAFGFFTFASVGVSIGGQIFSFFGIDYTSVTSNTKLPSSLPALILSFVSTAVLPPLIEEFALRGVVMGTLKKFGEVFAVVVSALLFGMMHGNFDQFPYAFVLGLVMGFAVIKTGSLWTSVIIHAINNTVSWCGEYIGQNISSELSDVSYVLYLVLSVVLTVLGVFLIKDKDVFSLKKADMVTTESKKYLNYFTSVGFILSLALFLYAAFFVYKA